MAVRMHHACDQLALLLKWRAQTFWVGIFYHTNKCQPILGRMQFTYFTYNSNYTCVTINFFSLHHDFPYDLQQKGGFAFLSWYSILIKDFKDIEYMSVILRDWKSIVEIFFRGMANVRWKYTARKFLISFWYKSFPWTFLPV